MKGNYSKTKIFIGAIFFVIFSLIFGCMLNFATPEQAYAENNITFKSSTSGAIAWNDEDKDGIYEVIIDKPTSNKSSTLAFTVSGEGTLEFSYTRDIGTFTYRYKQASWSSWETLTESSGTKQIPLDSVEEIQFKYLAQKGTTATATVGNFVFISQNYKISAGVNDESLGTVDFIDGEYEPTTPLTITATPNEGAIFLGFVDSDGKHINTDRHTFEASKDITFTAVFIKIDGEGTEENPYNFDYAISEISEHFAENATINYYRPTDGVYNSVYIAESALYTLSQDGVDKTATNSVYYLNINAGQVSTVAIKTGTKTFNFMVVNPGAGLAGSSITLGSGTETDPYLIYNEDNLQDINKAKSSVFKIVDGFDITKNFTPIGTAEDPFTGTLYGKGEETIISGLKAAKGSQRGLFAYTSGATIKDFVLTDINFSATKESGFLIGYASNATTVSNITVNGTLTATGANIGGIVGYALGESGVKASNCKVYGTISTTDRGIGGLSGTGGTFTDCIVYSSVSGAIVGGLTGGYTGSKNLMVQINNSSFTRCFVAGEVCLISIKNNYPYWGLLNGYGAWERYGITDSGQTLSIEYTSSIGVSNIEIFNVKDFPDGISITPKLKDGNTYYFSENIILNGTHALAEGSTLADINETKVTGITGNYGGFTIRFTMDNGTYKYVSTLNRAEAKFESNLNLNLDELTSYVDNFSNIEIDEAGTTSLTSKDGISIWGSAKVSNANDLEHLSWIVNGAIPTTFKDGLFYNARSVATISISLQNDIDLTAKRYLLSDGTVTEDETEGAYVLNTSNGTITGDMLYQFYGFGKSEMMPYRGSLYGNDHTLTVNMNFPNAYLMGILAVSTEQTYDVVVSNLTVEGTICGNKRVGIVGFFDAYERSGSLTFINVTNNATISGNYQVGGILGSAQGDEDKLVNLTFNNCVNNGNITASGTITSIDSVEAGGIVGSISSLSKYTNAILNNCTNSGNIYSTGTAGGFVGSAINIKKDENEKDVITYATVTVEEINISKGIIQGATGSSFYVGTKYIRAGSGTLKTLYELNILNKPQTEFSINNATYKTDDNSSLFVEFVNCETFNDVTISIANSYLNNASVINPDATTMISTVGNLPVAIEFANNTYEITGTEWVINAVVTFNDKTTTTISLTPNLDENTLKTNQLVFKNVSFSHSVYIIEETKTLSRITSGVEDYVTKAKALIDAKTGDDFLDLGTNTKTAYDTILAELNKIDADNVTRFNEFISNTITNNKNTNVSNDVMKDYYAVIVKTADLTNLEDITVSYQELVANSNIVKTISFTMLDNSTKNAQITYTFAKNALKIKENNANNLIYTVSTADVVSFKTEDNQVTYTYNENIDITITKQELGVNFTNVSDVVFDGTNKTITHELTQVLPNDKVYASLLYDGVAHAINAKTYEVTLNSTLTGDDAPYYVIPSEYTKGTLVINPLTVEAEVTSVVSFTYDAGAKTPTFNIANKVNGNIYEIKTSDYSVTYDTDSLVAPVNSGSHTLNITLTDNFVFDDNSKQESISFVINKAKITDIEIQAEYVYSKDEPTIVYKEFEGLLDEEDIVVSEYVIYKNNVEATSFNVGAYKLQVKQISANNYELADEIELDFSIIKREVEISYGTLTSVYGDDTSAILSEAEFEDVGTNKICEGDQLGVSLNQLTSLTVGTKNDLSVSWTNSNYNVELVETSYEITKREVTIEYVENNFTYNAEDQLSEIITPEIDNVVEADKNLFTFKLRGNVQEFKYVGDYTLEYIENEYVLENYTILNVLTNAYNIKKFDVTIEVNDLTKTYNEEITQASFSTSEIKLAGSDKLENVAELTYTVDGSAEIGVLDVGDYGISISFTAKELYNNYNFTVTNGNLHIIMRNTKLEAQNIEKKYDMSPVSLVAKLYGEDNEEILNPTITYTYYKNGSLTPEANNYALEVGTYRVHVETVADGNNDACEADFYITITKSKIKISIDEEDLIKTYDAENFDPSGIYSYTINGEESSLDLVELQVLTYNLLDKTSEETTEAKNAGNYYIEFVLSDDNFELETSKFGFEIKPIEITAEINERRVTYKDGYDIQDSSYRITNGAVLTGESLNITFIVDDYSEMVGEYKLTLENKNSNYRVTAIDNLFIIEKRELSLSYKGRSDLVYNKDGQSELLTVDVLNTKDNGVCTVYYTKENGQTTQDVFNAGTYYLCINLNDEHNYKFEDTEQKLISNIIFIDKQTHDLTIVLNGKTYDGGEIGESIISSNLANFDNSLYKIEYYLGEKLLTKKPVDAGDYTLKVVPIDEDNYLFENNSKDFGINKKEIKINPINESYNYNKLTIKPTLTLDGVVGSDNVTLETEYLSNNGEFIIVDDYKIHIIGLSGLKAENYELKSDEYIYYSIVPTIIDVESYVSEHTFTNIKLTNSQLELKFNNSLVYLTDYTVSELPTLVNDYTIYITSTNDGLVFGESNGEYIKVKELPLKIKKAQITGVDFKDYEVDYDNLPHHISVSNLTLANGTTLDVSYSENSFVDVGTYEVSATLTNANYETLVLKASLKIKQTEITVVIVGSNEYIYNKTPYGKAILDLETLWYKDLITYKYLGEGYDSQDKPINAGLYSLVLSPKNEENIKIVNTNNDFEIKTKEIALKDLTNQSAIYSKTQVEYVFDFTGKVADDEVFVNVLYNGEDDLPINASEYTITFNGLSGINSNNYYLKQPNVIPTLTITPKDVKVIAHNKEVIYGEPDVELTCDLDQLYVGDKYTGEITREQGNNVNSYKIFIGSLSAGDNYIINFVDAIYSIKQRPVTTNNFEKSFVYNEKSQIPTVTFNNILQKDGNIATISTVGDTVNAGQYTLKIVLQNYNYTLDCPNEYTISIIKKDISEKIIGLVSTEKDYDGTIFEPIVLIDGDYDYQVTYNRNGQRENEILNAGNYEVVVDLVDLNYEGQKVFEYVVNKISYSSSIIEDISIDRSSTTISVNNLNNINVGINSAQFSNDNTIGGLTENTSYEIFIKVLASENFKETVFSLGEQRTSTCATRINKETADLLGKELSAEDVFDIKEILIDCEYLSDSEKLILNDEDIETLKEEYLEFIKNVNEEVEQVKLASNLVDLEDSKVETVAAFTSVMFLMGASLIFVKGKKKDETKN